MKLLVRLLGWCVAGAACAFVTLELPIAGLPVALALVTWRAHDAAAFGMLIGAAAVPLSVAYANRAGPGTTCSTLVNGFRCDQSLNPWPWLGVGLGLLGIGVAGFAIRSRAAPASPGRGASAAAS